MATLAGLTTPSEEKEVIANCYALYRKHQRQLSFIGQPSLADSFPAADLAIGETSLLSFQFIDPATEQPAVGPAIGAVFYEINTDPSHPDIFLPLGTSFDPASNFAFPFTLNDFEPDIQAVPFDTAGHPIVIAGVDGINVAVGSVTDIPVPEPPTASLLGSAVLSLLTWATWRQRASGCGTIRFHQGSSVT
jgi:hypothetical protein